jgi:hypothetical protein
MARFPPSLRTRSVSRVTQASRVTESVAATGEEDRQY